MRSAPWMVVGLLSVASPSLAAGQEVRWLYPAVVTTHALDLHSTWQALATNPQATEANPLLRPWIQSRPGMVALKGGAVAVEIASAEYLRRHGHPRLAFWTMLSVRVVHGVVIWQNYRLAHS